jgi:hypothetical protein
MVAPENDSAANAQLRGVNPWVSDALRNTSIATSTEAPESSMQIPPRQMPCSQLASSVHELSGASAP